MKNQLIKLQKFFLLIAIVSATMLVSCKSEIDKGSGVIKSETKSKPADYHRKLLAMQERNLGKYSQRAGGEAAPSFRDSLVSAIKLSIAGKYDDSKQALLTLLKTNPESEELVLQVAVQDFYLGNYANSIKRLSQVVRTQNDELRHEAEMMLAQATLSLEDGYATSKKWLSKIAKDPKSPYSEDAKGQLRLFD